MEQTVAVLPYDPEWPRKFEAEREILEPILAPWLSEGIHHIGSTAVPGLSAKPVLDMMAGVRDLRAAEQAIEPLQAIGYLHSPHRPRALWFRKPGTDDYAERTHHLHLTEPGSDLWQERLAFRDALRENDALREEYEQLKLRLASDSEEVARYTEQKRPFVVRVLATKGVVLTPRWP